MEDTIIVLVSAHFIADFMLQPDALLQRKGQVWAIVLHAASVAFLGYLFMQQWSAWAPLVMVFLLHAIIDGVKQRCNDTSRTFCIDQFAHLISIVFVVWVCRTQGWMADFSGVGQRWMVLMAGFAGCVPGAGFLVGKVAGKLQEENGLGAKMNGLKNGGQLIGQLERTLIFLFIIIGQPGGIGFLVAAKSILRFGEAKDDQKLAEYVLIGTLLSFGLAIAIASLTRYLFESIRS
jgi:hypothetical protein